MQRGLRGILAAAFIWGGACVAQQNQDDPVLARRVLVDLNSADFRVASQAALDAEKCFYQEVADALILQLERTDVQPANTSFGHVINYAIQSFSKRGTSYQVQALLQAKPNLIRLLTGNKLSTQYLSKFEQVIATMKTRSIPLQRLNGATVAATVANPARQPTGAPLPITPSGTGSANTPPSPVTSPSQAPNKLVRDLVKEAKSPDEKMLLEFLAAIEGCLFDDAMHLLNSGQSLPNFSSREDDLEKLVQAMLRREKSHVLVLGKAGIGKTTLVRMLQNGWIENRFSFPGDEVPLVLELSILDVTNPSDPTIIKNRINAANKLAELLNRDVLLFLDESQVSTPLTKNAIKSFLTRANELAGNRVHLVWATTSNESKALVGDPAFARRWVTITLEEFTNEEAIDAVRKANIGPWQIKHHIGSVGFLGVTEDAFSFGNRYRHLEQPHAGNPTALKEILEGAIVYRLRQLEKKDLAHQLRPGEGQFFLQSTDIRNYLKFQKGYRLLPGDRDFDQTFRDMWDGFRKDYIGQDGAMVQVKTWLRSHFSTLDRDMLLVIGNFGPPSAGKSFLAEMIAKHFFRGALQPINAGMFSEGHPLNTLIGSPPGLEGSAEELGILPKFIRENPNGGVIVIEEADYLPQQVLDFFVDTITRREFTDSRGQTWRMDNYIIQLNSNIGQEYLIPTDMKTRMTWDEYRSREMAMTHRVFVDGQELNVVRPDRLDQIMKNFVARVAKGRNDGETNTTDHEQKGIKLLRRIKPMYSLLPSEDQLRQFGYNLVERYKAEKLKDYKVTFVIPPDVVDAVMNLKFYRFEQGYSYVESRITHDLLSHLNSKLDLKDQTMTVSTQSELIKSGRRTIAGKRITLKAGDWTDSYVLDPTYGASDNIWFANVAMRERIANYATRMTALIKGQKRQIEYMAELLRQKVFNWNIKLNIAQIGTSGNGKTEFGYATAEVLFGSRAAAFKISGINTWADLQNHFRSPVGFVGSNEETPFEIWFKNRMNAGGGVIILDEILSFDGLSSGAIADRINAINKLFDMLDERTISFKGKPEDARAFIVLLTGNSMQELFSGIDDSPDAEYQIRRILESVSHADIVKFFRRIGLGASQLARFGEIFLNGPLDKATTLSVGGKEIRRAITDALQEIADMYEIRVDVDPAIVAGIVDRVTTVTLGLRHVQMAINKVIGQPITGILNDMDGATEISGRLVDGRIEWFSDGQKLKRVATTVPGSEVQQYRWQNASDTQADLLDATVQLSDVEVIPKVKVTDEQLHVVFVHEAKGHWRSEILLRGESQTVSISLIPGERSLGYVRSDNKDTVDVTGINYAMREVAILEAGHRAVFRAGYYSFGGGGSGDPEDKRRQDDLFRVNRMLNAVLSNQLFPNFTEYSSARDKQLFIDFMRNIGKGIADRVVRYGEVLDTSARRRINNPVKDGLFEDFFADLLKHRFAGEEKIKDFLSSLPPGYLPDPDLLYAGVLSRAVLAELKKPHYESLNRVDRVKVVQLAMDLIQTTLREIRTVRRTDAAVVQKLMRLQTSSRAALDALMAKWIQTLCVDHLTKVDVGGEHAN